MIEDLMKELSAAMRYNPDLSVTQVIKVVTDVVYPTRKYQSWLWWK
mgnify:CR=1 FL=1